MTIRRFFLLLILAAFAAGTYLAGETLRELREYERRCTAAGGKIVEWDNSNRRVCARKLVVIPVEQGS